MRMYFILFAFLPFLHIFQTKFSRIYSQSHIWSSCDKNTKLNPSIGILHLIFAYTKLYSFKLDCNIVSLTAANTNLMFSVSVEKKEKRNKEYLFTFND